MKNDTAQAEAAESEKRAAIGREIGQAIAKKIDASLLEIWEANKGLVIAEMAAAFHAVQTRTLVASSESATAEKIMRYIQKHLRKRISRSYLAKVFLIHPDYLEGLFNKTIGMGVRAYHQQVRVAKARQLIEKGTDLNSLHKKVGFAQPSHLAAQFKRLVGVSLEEYPAVCLAKKVVFREIPVRAQAAA